MNKYILYTNASIVAGIIALLMISSTLLSTNSVWASLSATQKKDHQCAGTLHTRNYCDGWHLARADASEKPNCDDSNYRGDDKSHTKNWRDGYVQGWRSAC
jgi:hypothetical protein